jgi:hypothetical protein
MPYDVRLSSDGPIIHLTATGPFDFEAALPVFTDVERALERSREAAILVDVRDIEYTPSVADVKHFVARHAELTRVWRNPHALVTSPGVNFGMAMMMCTLIEVTGGKSQAFTDREEAENWLLNALRQRSSSPSS